MESGNRNAKTILAVAFLVAAVLFAVVVGMRLR